MAMRLTGKRALVAVAAGLALVGTPAFALAAAPATAFAAGVQGRAVTVEHNAKNGNIFWNADDCLKESLEDQTVGDITLNADGNWDPASGIEVVTVDRDLTIHGRNTDKDYINDIQFIVTSGHTLTLDNVNLYTRPLDTDYSRTVVEVQGGGKLVTKGTGDIVSNGGNTEAVAIKLESGAKAELGAAPSGFSWGSSWAGVYGASYAIKAEANSDLKITNGRFLEENGRGEAIVSSGRVTVDPVDGAGFQHDGSALANSNLGTIRMDGASAVLVAKSTQFGLNDGAGHTDTAGITANRENANVQGNVTAVNGANVYLTDCASTSSTVDTSAGSNDIAAISVDKDSTVYSQDNYWNTDMSTYTTDFDLPGFSKLTSAYEGDHLTKNAYYVEGTNESINNTVEGSTHFFKIADGESFNDLESQVAAKADDLKADVTANEDGDTAAVKAALPLGKSNVYGKYEIAKNDDTGIKGDGRVYEVSAVQNLQAGWDVSVFRGNGAYTAPTTGDTNAGVADETVPDGLVFAGWYKVGGDLTTGAASGTPWQSDVAVPEGNAAASELKPTEKTGYAYAKFIPADFLKASAQREAVTGKKGYNVRFLSAVDSYNYNSVAYKVQLVDQSGANEGDAQTINTTTAFDYLGVTKGNTTSKVRAWDSYDTADAKYSYAADDVHAARYFTRAVVKDVDKNFNGSFKVTVSVTTPDGTVVTGPESTLTTMGLNDSVE